MNKKMKLQHIIQSKEYAGERMSINKQHHQKY